MTRSLHAYVLAAMLGLLGGAAAAAEEPVGGDVKGETLAISGEVVAVSGEIVPIVARIEDVGGSKLALQVKETKTEIRIELAADVLFDFDKADLRPEAKEALQKAAALIREHAKKGSVLIEGHTDGKGADGYNQKLSERRAQTVRDYFVRTEKLKGLSFSAKGFGKTRPVAPNAKPDGSDDPDGRQKNRRVEIVVRKI